MVVRGKTRRTGQSKPNKSMVVRGKTRRTGQSKPNGSMVVRGKTRRTGQSTPNGSMVVQGKTCRTLLYPNVSMLEVSLLHHVIVNNLLFIPGRQVWCLGMFVSNV